MYNTFLSTLLETYLIILPKTARRRVADQPGYNGRDQRPAKGGDEEASQAPGIPPVSE